MRFYPRIGWSDFTAFQRPILECVLCLECFVYMQDPPHGMRGTVVNDCQIYAPAPLSHVTLPHRPDTCHRPTCWSKTFKNIFRTSTKSVDSDALLTQRAVNYWWSFIFCFYDELADKLRAAGLQQQPAASCMCCCRLLLCVHKRERQPVFFPPPVRS